MMCGITGFLREELPSASIRMDDRRTSLASTPI